jgi:tetratricopeptide (TPR) repeat protein
MASGVHLTRLLGLLALGIGVGGCANTGPTPAGGPVTAADLAGVARLETTAFGGPGDAPEVDVLALTDAMRRFADDTVRNLDNRHARLLALEEALFNPNDLKIEYTGRTYTAAEAFATRAGDCLSLSNLFVALARYAGIEAHFQEVSRLYTFGRSQDHELFVVRHHINVTGPTGSGTDYVIDFTPDDPRDRTVAFRVPDTRARAQYYNNIAMEAFTAGDARRAVPWLKRAILTDPHVDFVWSNLGVVYGRSGSRAAAEAAYRVALRVNPEHLPTMANLSILYHAMGRTADAERLQRLVQHYRLKNPYYRLELADAAYRERRYEDALEHMRTAVRLQRDDAELQYALAKVYRTLGREHEARSAEAAALERSFGTGTALPVCGDALICRETG